MDIIFIIFISKMKLYLCLRVYAGHLNIPDFSFT